ncbi:MAG: UDP-N-acetylmuramate dehydrogenase [Clostridia bacterium]|nr:UDP-N-acetylmuramate dehydrogenase [Clostridia bacterium]
MTNGIKELKLILDSASAHKIKYSENEPLSVHSSFKIGGNADLFAIPNNTDELKFLIRCAAETDVPVFILGHGSNILFDDGGYKGLIISTEGMNSVKVEGNIMTAECGALLTRCAVLAKDASLSGMECLYGIPGSVGGAVFMNAGAYGGEMKDIVRSSTYLDLDTLEICTIEADEHDFAYRHSVFTEKNAVILSTVMELVPSDISLITERMNDYKKRRIEKQPLDYPSAGSTFKRYPGKYTAQMIDEAGLKGYTIGGAQVSEKHAGFVINKGNATSKDVLELIDTIKKKIKCLHGIDIETEVIYVK